MLSSCLPSPVYGFLSPVYRLLPPISFLSSPVSCLPCPVSCLLPNISCLTCPVSRLLSHAFFLTYPVSCLGLLFTSHVAGLLSGLSQVSCFKSHVSCLLSWLNVLWWSFSGFSNTEFIKQSRSLETIAHLNRSSEGQIFSAYDLTCLIFGIFLYHFVSHTKNAVRCEEKHAKLRLNFFFAVSLCLFSSVSLRFALKQSEACSFCIVYSTRDFQLFFIKRYKKMVLRILFGFREDICKKRASA